MVDAPLLELTPEHDTRFQQTLHESPGGWRPSEVAIWTFSLNEAISCTVQNAEAYKNSILARLLNMTRVYAASDGL